MMPSPTKAVTPLSRLICSRISNFSSGRRPAWYSVIPHAAAASLAASSWSPVSITIRLTPSARNCFTARAESSRSLPETETAPKSCPPRATYTISFGRAEISTPCSCMSRFAPQRISSPSAITRVPPPGVSEKLLIRDSSISPKASEIDRAIGCLERHSASAAASKTACSETPFTAAIWVTVN